MLVGKQEYSCFAHFLAAWDQSQVITWQVMLACQAIIPGGDIPPGK